MTEEDILPTVVQPGHTPHGLIRGMYLITVLWSCSCKLDYSVSLYYISDYVVGSTGTGVGVSYKNDPGTSWASVGSTVSSIVSTSKVRLDYCRKPI